MKQTGKYTKPIVFTLVLLLVSGMVAAMSGCDVGDLVSVKTPPKVQQTTGLPSKLTLNESQIEYQDWLLSVQSQGSQWKNSIEKGNEVKNVINQLTMAALDTVGPSINGIPMLGPAIPLIAGLVGLSLRRPGDVSKDDLRKEKENSFNAGIERATKTLTS